MLVISSIKVRSFDLDFLDVQWAVAPHYEDVRDYTFVVEKATSSMGPYYDLTGEITDKYRLRDNTVRTNLDHYRETFYRVRVKHLPTATSVTYPTTGVGVALEAELDLQALEMARQERLVLQEVDGRLLWVFPRRRFGARCSCYDVTMSRRVRSGCRTCYDTGWIGGYESPLQVYGQITVGGVAEADTLVTEQSQETAAFRLPNYPQVRPGDIIVEAENRRWRIADGVLGTEKLRAVVRYSGMLHRVAEGDIEYLLPINVADPFALEPTPVRNLLNPSTAEMGDVVDTALGRYKTLLRNLG